MTHRITSSLIDELKNWITQVDEEEPKKTVPVTAPFDGSTIHELPLCNLADVTEAFRRARLAQERWANKSVHSRVKIFSRYHDAVLDQREEIMDLIQLETGKVRKNAFEEVADVVNVCRYYTFHAEEILKPRRRRGAFPILTETWEQHIPTGVVGVISPWNCPFSLAMSDVMTALIAGNAVILKPDRQTSISALWGLKRLEEAGLPLELLQVVTGTDSDVTEAVARQADFIIFTGSNETGKTVTQIAGERILGYSMELAGKNPMIILPDADLRKTAEGAVRACFTNAGQLSVSIERILVHESLYERFLNMFAQRTRKMKIGAGYDYPTEMGSLVSSRHLQRVKQHVDDAVDKGAKLVVGGNPLPDIGPYFFEPTILTGVTRDMLLYEQETFGPVVAVYSYRSTNEAIDKANETPYGLNACIWTRDTDGIRKLASQLHFGTVNVNEAYAAAWGSVDSPIGGCKESGVGRRHGREGMLRFTETQTVSTQRMLPFCAPKGISERTYSRLISGTLKLMSKIPGLR